MKEIMVSGVEERTMLSMDRRHGNVLKYVHGKYMLTRCVDKVC